MALPLPGHPASVQHCFWAEGDIQDHHSGGTRGGVGLCLQQGCVKSSGNMVRAGHFALPRPSTYHEAELAPLPPHSEY